MEKTKIILVLLLIALGMMAIVGFLFTGLDHIVNGDFYRYGLHFDYGWAGQYWTYSRFITESLAVTMVMIGVAVFVLLLNHPKYRADYAKSAYFPLLLIGIVTIGILVFFLSRLDYLVNSVIYSYGLNFSYDWANNYWAHLRSILVLSGFAGSVMAVSIGLALVSKPPKNIELASVVRGYSRKFNWANLVILLLLSSGVASLGLSVHLNFSFLATLGLGLIFWGAILLYIRPEDYVKEIILKGTSLPSLVNLGRTIEQMGYQGTPIYLPPAFNNLKSSKIYISVSKDRELPSLAEVAFAENEPFSRHAQGLFLIPVGIELAELAEKKMKRTEGKYDLEHLARKLPRVLVEDFGLARKVELEISNPKVLVKVRHSLYDNVCRETGKSSKTCASFGCPLCSAIACLLAKSTQRPVAIEADRVREDGNVVDLEYRIL